VDLRAVGSRNVGATNMYRASGPRLGAAVMALDMAKGALAVAVTSAAVADANAVAAGVAAVAGHIYPVWLRGHGGKGVSTACGAFLLLAPFAAAVAAAAFVVTVWATRIVSAGSDHRGTRRRGSGGCVGRGAGRGADSVAASEQPGASVARHRAPADATRSAACVVSP
jgi:acyl phosphate:glycerol-3-phosphate acyltransferase